MYWFPSPLGDYVFNHVVRKPMRLSMDVVSVPSRGLCFQSWWTKGEWTYAWKVSVPSRGLCFQSGTFLSRHLKNIWLFPSPLGDYVFNRKGTKVMRVYCVGFRPLSGIMFSIKCTMYKYRIYTSVSVPSRGLCFQSKVNEIEYWDNG